MKISTRGRYGLRAMAFIAAMSVKGVNVVSTKSIAAGEGISENYLEQIIAPLKQSGLLKSIRGAGGGYTLTKIPAEITAGQVLRAVEGSLSPAECLEGGVNASDSCSSCENCAAKSVLSKVYESVNEAVDSITIADLI